MDIDNMKYDLAIGAIERGADPKCDEDYPLIKSILNNSLDFVDWLIRTYYKDIEEEDKERLDNEIRVVCEIHKLKNMYVYFRTLGFTLKPLKHRNLIIDPLENYYKMVK